MNPSIQGWASQPAVSRTGHFEGSRWDRYGPQKLNRVGYWASYIFIDRERTRLFVDRWGARYCCHWLFWGADLLEPMVRGLEPDFEDGVPGWAEGGMTVDLQAKRLTWFCEDPVYDCLSTIEVLLPLQRALWPGWEVHWAARGLDDLLSLAGLPAKPMDYQAYEARRSEFRETTPGGPVLDVAELYEQTFVQALFEPEGEPFGVASLREPDGRRKLLPLRDGDIEELFEFGPIRLLDGLGARVSHPSVVLPAQAQLAQGGFDIDPMTRTLRYWSSDSVWSGYFPKVWEGWTLVDW